MVLYAIFLDDGRRVTGIFETRADPIEALRQQNRVNTAQSALANGHVIFDPPFWVHPVGLLRSQKRL